jgi:L-threonylcarbamoyladenylate synthase
MKIFEKDIEHCLEVLRQGGLVLYPTDTIWGIGCDATHEMAVSRIYRLKQRAETKSMIILLGDQRDLLRYVAALDLEVFNYLDSVSKPTTVVYDGAIHLASNLVNADGSIGIRVTRDEFCRDLVLRFRKPIVSTSANLSGQPAPRFFDEIQDEIKKGVDYIVRYRQEDHEPKQASSVVKWKNGGEVTIIRP